ncbi:MAG TPA: fructose 1,6-bisphosphatase [Candidatus Aenigmarchaeota archaeon]|nr:MAG: fructose 1,6-bisphosphatase [Candidatus Aenigmarchaeota archaeon]HDD46524.1 fructose 1,6-bisphosphatase [Candidatus Aenigmarchaeota archaeon]
MKITLSVLKADVGGFVGHSHSHPDILKKAREMLEEAKNDNKIIDFYVTACGDDLELIITHNKGIENKEVHGIAWSIFTETSKLAKELKLYGAGQDILKTTFSGNLRGLGPGVAEMEFEERESEPVIIFMADKTEPGAFSLPLYKMFGDAFNTPGLVIDPNMRGGFSFDVHDVKKHRHVWLHLPEEMYKLLGLIGTVGRYEIKSVIRREDNEIAAVTSTERLNLIAGKYVGKDDPVLIVRAQHGFPDVGEILEPFAIPHFVAGWNRGSHNGPLMPVPQRYANTSRFDGPPRIIALGFQLNNGKLEGPVDMFDDPAFDDARRQAIEMANYIRRNGTFQPHRLEEDEMEYTKITAVEKELEEAKRFEKL